MDWLLFFWFLAYGWIGIGIVLLFMVDLQDFYFVGLSFRKIICHFSRFICRSGDLSALFLFYLPLCRFICQTTVLSATLHLSTNFSSLPTRHNLTERSVKHAHHLPPKHQKKHSAQRRCTPTYFNSTLSITTSCEPSTSPVAPSKNLTLVSSLKGVVNVYSKRSIFSLSSAISERYLVY